MTCVRLGIGDERVFGKAAPQLLQKRESSLGRGFPHEAQSFATKLLPDMNTQRDKGLETPTRMPPSCLHLTLLWKVRQVMSPKWSGYFNVSRASRSAAVSRGWRFLTISTSFLRPLGLPIINTPTSL